MGFLLPALPAILGAAGSVGGALLGGSANKAQNQLVQQQMLTEQDQRNLMDQYAKLQQQYGTDAANFYLQYMAKGNPFLSNLLSQHFGQIQQQYGNQQGLLSQKLAASGYGAAPSGLAAASAGDLSRAEAGTQSESWLNDMLQNEQIKFQAAQGLGGIANMFQPGQFALHRFSNPQVPQSPWTQVPGAIGQGLSGLLSNLPGNSPLTPGPGSPTPQVPTPPSPYNLPPGSIPQFPIPNFNPGGTPNSVGGGS
jgi:hypothetical protein